MSSGTAARKFWSTFTQEILSFFSGNICPSLSKLCAAKIEIYHHYTQSLKSVYSMQILAAHDLHRKNLFFDFAGRKKNIFSRPACTNSAGS